MILKNKKIFITGGAGYLGKHLIKRWVSDNKITVFSRDEAKHYFLKKQYPDVEFIVGDVRNYDLLKRASKGHDIGIFAASLKQIEACQENYEEATQVIVHGAFNSRRCAVENGFEAACFISTDKAVSPTTIYGLCKGLAGEAFISNNKSDTRLVTAVYGNILNSTGSIIPLMWDSIFEGRELTLYGEDMTRFALMPQDAIHLIEIGLEKNNITVVPKALSFKLTDLFDIFEDEFGLKYKIGTPRSSEKIHEIMISSEQIPRTFYCKEHELFYISQDKIASEPQFNFINNEYSSRDYCVEKEYFRKTLEKVEYFY